MLLFFFFFFFQAEDGIRDGTVTGVQTCALPISDKQSKEKVDLLKALGAEVIVCPTAVEPEDPRSYYSVAKKLAREIPNSYYPNQYDNPMNPEAHYRTTGPEIWEDSEGKITHRSEERRVGKE